MAGKQTKSAPVEPVKETDQEQEQTRGAAEETPVNDAGNPVVPITSAAWHEPDPAQQGQIFCKSGPYRAPGEPV